MISAFGIDHGPVSKADAQGTLGSRMEIEHRRGEHEPGAKPRACPACRGDAHGSVQHAPKLVPVARKVFR